MPKLENFGPCILVDLELHSVNDVRSLEGVFLDLPPLLEGLILLLMHLLEFLLTLHGVFDPEGEVHRVSFLEIIRALQAVASDQQGLLELELDPAVFSTFLSHPLVIMLLSIDDQLPWMLSSFQAAVRYRR